MSTKQRLSASVDPAALDAALAAVAEGRASNVSTWVNEALLRHAEHDRRLRALDAFLSAYEAEHGTITDDEIRDAGRRMRARAVVVRGKARGTRSRPKRDRRARLA
jgi:hypothetical protein